jgi:hypothetical protein
MQGTTIQNLITYCVTVTWSLPDIITFDNENGHLDGNKFIILHIPSQQNDKMN